MTRFKIRVFLKSGNSFDCDAEEFTTAKNIAKNIAGDVTAWKGSGFVGHYPHYLHPLQIEAVLVKPYETEEKEDESEVPD